MMDRIEPPQDDDFDLSVMVGLHVDRFVLSRYQLDIFLNDDASTEAAIVTLGVNSSSSLAVAIPARMTSKMQTEAFCRAPFLAGVSPRSPTIEPVLS